jgi:hypothetical protein
MAVVNLESNHKLKMNDISLSISEQHSGEYVPRPRFEHLESQVCKQDALPLYYLSIMIMTV